MTQSQIISIFLGLSKTKWSCYFNLRTFDLTLTVNFLPEAGILSHEKANICFILLAWISLALKGIAL